MKRKILVSFIISLFLINCVLATNIWFDPDSYQANTYDPVAVGWGKSFDEWINLSNLFDNNDLTYGTTPNEAGSSEGYNWSSVNMTFTAPPGANLSQSILRSVVSDAGEENTTLANCELNDDGTLTIIAESYFEDGSPTWGYWFMCPSPISDYIPNYTGYEFCGGNCNSSYMYEFDMIWLDDSGTPIINDIQAPSVTLNSPANQSSIEATSVTFNCSATDDTAVVNISLFIEGSLITTVTNTTGDQTYIELVTSATPSEGNIDWYCTSSDYSGNQGTSLTNIITFTLPATPATSIESICSDSGNSLAEAAAIAGLILTIALVGIALTALFLSVSGFIDLGRLTNEFTLENTVGIVMVIGLLYLVIATMAFLILNGVCPAYGG